MELYVLSILYFSTSASLSFCLYLYKANILPRPPAIVAIALTPICKGKLKLLGYSPISQNAISRESVRSRIKTNSIIVPSMNIWSWFFTHHAPKETMWLLNLRVNCIGVTPFERRSLEFLDNGGHIAVLALQLVISARHIGKGAELLA